MRKIFYRYISFELSTKAMSRVLQSSTKGYAILRREMDKLGFDHSMGVVYRSRKALNYAELTQCVTLLGERVPWLAECIKSGYVQSLGERDFRIAESLRALVITKKKEVFGTNSSD